jgi:hypothetical protein
MTAEECGEPCYADCEGGKEQQAKPSPTTHVPHSAIMSEIAE